MQVEKRIDSERSRTQYYLASQTEAPLLVILEDKLLSKHLQTVVSLPASGLDAMIDGDKLDDLARLYRLGAIIPTGLMIVKKALKESILKRGKEINAIGTEGTAEGDADGDEEPLEEADEPKNKGKKKGGPTRGPAARAVETALQWVQSVLDLKDRYEKLLRVCFAGDLSVQTSIGDVSGITAFRAMLIKSSLLDPLSM